MHNSSFMSIKSQAGVFSVGWIFSFLLRKQQSVNTLLNLKAVKFVGFLGVLTFPSTGKVENRVN